jgi:hypothetical protein
MQATGQMVIGGHEVYGAVGMFRAEAPQSGELLEPAFGVATAAQSLESQADTLRRAVEVFLLVLVLVLVLDAA